VAGVEASLPPSARRSTSAEAHGAVGVPRPHDGEERLRYGGSCGAGHSQIAAVCLPPAVQETAGVNAILGPMAEIRVEGDPYRVAESIPDPWPLSAQLAELEKIDPKDVVNAEKLGDAKFDGADQQYRQILDILRALRLEDWDRLPTDLTVEIEKNATELLKTVKQMAELSPTSRRDYSTPRTNLLRQFTEQYTFFRNRVWPLCLTQRLSEVLRKRSDLWGGDLSAERLGQLQAEFDRLEAAASELQQLAPVVEAQRELLGESGVTKLSHDFDERASQHATSFKRWAFGLVVAVVGSGIGVVLVAILNRPADDATNAQIATHAFIDLAIIGLIIFLVRFVATQTRAHRHMQFVARNKANALSTFNRLVSGQQDPEVRSNVAVALAQAVFKSDDGVFSDASGDTVTIVERLGSAWLPRPGGS
jgi:hypothetical protein